MKKSSFISILRHVALFLLIFAISLALSMTVFINQSNNLCSFGVKTACKVSMTKIFLKHNGMNKTNLCGFENGGMNFLGFLILKDELKTKCLENSCRNNSPVGCYYLGVDSKYAGKESKDMFVSACEKGRIVAACYEAGKEFLKIGDKNTAAEYFLKACKSGFLKSCVMAAPFSDDENFQKLAAVAKEQMLGYEGATKLKTEDENGNSVKIREISPEQKSKIMDNELALIWPTAAVFFARIGIPERSLHYLKKAITIKKYAIYEVLSDRYWTCKDEACSSIVLETLKDIDAEISFCEKELAKITPTVEQ